MKRLTIDESKKIWERAVVLIPMGTQMMSKTPAQFIEGEYPLYLRSGKGSHVRDVDGNEYIDFMSAFGTVLLGHAHEGINAAVRSQLEDGIIFSLPHPLELRVAEKLNRCVPCAEMARFFKTGSESTSAAIRVARAATGRTLIAKCASGYHGWHDWHAVETARSAGIPEALKGMMVEFPYNDIAALEQLFADSPGRIACVMMEPVVLDEPRDGFLDRVRELCTRQGTVLIFDETVSGLRFAAGGAQQRYNVTPDLACFGKAMANGLPLSAVVGKREFMGKFEAADVFISSTFGGDAVSLAAADYVLDAVLKGGVVENIWERGRELKDALSTAAKGLKVPIECRGLPPRMVLFFEAAGKATGPEIRTLFLQQCIRQGILFGNVILVNGAHTKEDIRRAAAAAETAMEAVAVGLAQGDLAERIQGKVAVPAFNLRKDR